VTIPNPQHVAVYIGLDQGEAEVLALAEAHPPRLVVIDELRGRRYAQRLGLPLTGTLGILLLAKERGLDSGRRTAGARAVGCRTVSVAGTGGAGAGYGG